MKLLKKTAFWLCVLLVSAGLGWTYFSIRRKPDRPNVVWIVWDTVRADHLSLYGYDRQTTPFLDSWAKNARVFDNCISAANCTVPSHASMFTGLAPSEHLCTNSETSMRDSYKTIAEWLSDAGYRTFLYSANPHISASRNFAQGFDVEEHPWDEQFRGRALQIIRNKMEPVDRSSELSAQIRSNRVTPWMIKACGELAQHAVENWLDRSKKEKPFFVFLNYMEAHRPYIPPRSFRQRLMTPEQVTRSYTVDRSWTAMWSYTFGLSDYSDQDIAITRLTYDATLAELDDLLKNLLLSLKNRGDLDNTVVIITADHGEQLGEHHMLDHQYSVYEPLIHVPLVVYYPPRLSPGREARPVMNSDLFATVLELAGIETTEQQRHRSVSLLHPMQKRIRIAECPSFPREGFRAAKRRFPDFDSTPWQRTLTAVYDADNKFIWSSDGRYELYHLADDIEELNNLAQIDSELSKRMLNLHDVWIAGLNVQQGQTIQKPLSDDQRRRLESLGYLAPESPPKK